MNTEVPKNERIKTYKYGKQQVPFNNVAVDVLKYKTPVDLKLL